MQITNAQIYTRNNGKAVVYQMDRINFNGKPETLRVIEEAGKPARIRGVRENGEEYNYLNRGWKDLKKAVIAAI